MPGRGGRARPARYGSFPTTADMGLSASAPDPPALFEALGMGLFALMTDLRRVRPREAREVHARGGDLGALVVGYLSELVKLEAADGFVGRRVRVELSGDPPRELRAAIEGERLDPARHVRRKEIKAITFHRLEASLDPPRVRVIVDI